MFSYIIECVLLHGRMCSLTVHSGDAPQGDGWDDRMCSLICYNVFSYIIECVLLHGRMCSLTVHSGDAPQGKGGRDAAAQRPQPNI